MSPFLYLRCFFHLSQEESQVFDYCDRHFRGVPNDVVYHT